MASGKVLFWAILSYFMFPSHNHWVEFVVLFFSLSYSCQIGWSPNSFTAKEELSPINLIHESEQANVSVKNTVIQSGKCSETIFFFRYHSSS